MSAQPEARDGTRMMADYEVTIRVRNARMLRKMKECGIANAAELSRVSGASYSLVVHLLNLKISALRVSGELRPVVNQVCEVLRCLPEDIIPAKHFESALRKNSATFDATLEDVESLVSYMKPAALPDKGIEVAEAHASVGEAISLLSEREQKIISLRFGLDGDEPKSLTEIGEIFGVTRNRIRQIEAKALRTLKFADERNGGKLTESYQTICESA